MAEEKQKTRLMTTGPIMKQLILFSLPLMAGNIFQMLYNTVDSIVVGNFVGKEALAAVGSTTMIVNMMVFFFNGFSVGAGVVIGHFFGARREKKLHEAVETAMAMTFIFCLVMSLLGVAGVDGMLRFMDTPEDVFEQARTYLTIYFIGISGLLIYNIGSGILRAVGNTRTPLYFLILTSCLNTALDLVFVLVFHMGVAGVAYATILAQMVSAILILRLLVRTKEIYRFSFRELQISSDSMKMIFRVGLPAGIQSVITAFSNVFVQSYINFFGSDVMAGWSCYNKLDQFIMLPMQSFSMGATTFVSQNMGAGETKRAKQGTISSCMLAAGVTGGIAVLLFAFAAPAVSLFSPSPGVVRYGALFLHYNVFFLICNAINHTLAGALRGRGDSRGPMMIMLTSFVAIRQVYLFLVTRFIANSPGIVGFGYPVGWVSCFILETAYFFLRWGRETRKTKKAEKVPADL